MLKTLLAFLLVASLISCSNHNPAAVPVADTLAATVKKYPFEQEILKYEAKDSAKFPEPGMVLFIGSSSVRLWKTLQKDMSGIRVLNRGFGGAITCHVLHYMDRIVFPYKPSVIVYYCGENDISVGIPVNDILSNYRKFFDAVRDSLPDTRVLVLSNKPSLRRKDQLGVQKNVNKALQLICNDYPFVRFIDVSTPMMINDSTVRNDIFKPDSLHLNDKGYAIWTEIIRKELEQK